MFQNPLTIDPTANSHSAPPSQERVNADETAIKEENKKVWLWTFSAPRFSVFEHLTSATRSHLANQPAPSLLPRV